MARANQVHRADGGQAALAVRFGLQPTPAGYAEPYGLPHVNWVDMVS
jgi:hypothetical protein